MANVQRLSALALATVFAGCSVSRVNDAGPDFGVTDGGREDASDFGMGFDASDGGHSDAGPPSCGMLGARVGPLDVTGHVPSGPGQTAIAPDRSLTWLERTTEWSTVTAAPDLAGLAVARAAFIPITIGGRPIPGPYFLTAFDTTEDSWLLTFGDDAADAQRYVAVLLRDGSIRGAPANPLPAIGAAYDVRGMFAASDGTAFRALAIERSVLGACAQRVRELRVPFDGSTPTVGPAVDMDVSAYPQWVAGAWLFVAPAACVPGAPLDLWTLPIGATAATSMRTDLPSAIFYLWAPAGNSGIAAVLGVTDTDPPRALSVAWLDRATGTMSRPPQEVFRSSTGFVQTPGTILLADGDAAIVLRVDERVADPGSETEWLVRAAAGGTPSSLLLSGPQPPTAIIGRLLLSDGRQVVTDWSIGSRHFIGGALCSHVP